MCDCNMIRTYIPSKLEIKLSMILKLVKELIGRDITKMSLPVFLNEPCTVLMKPAEFMFFNHFLTEAVDHEDSVARMLHVTVSMIAPFYCVPYRLGKPFNPLLGETYELVTPKFRFFGEMVSHHPPICAWVCQGPGYEIQRTMETSQGFTGKSVKVSDVNPNRVTLQVRIGDRLVEERYECMEPDMVVGNLVMGERYVEP